MGFIFQFYNLLPVLSAVENVELPLLVSGMKPSDARERAMQSLAQVGLEDRARHKPMELSGGQRQRVTIARALVNEPAIVWADEPTGDLDSETADEIMNLMRTLNVENGQTFVVVTHDPRIGAMCDRIIRMQDGQIVDEGLGEAVHSPSVRRDDAQQLPGVVDQNALIGAVLEPEVADVGDGSGEPVTGQVGEIGSKQELT